MTRQPSSTGYGTRSAGTTLNTGAALRYSLYSSSALNWDKAADPRPDYYRYLPSYYKSNEEAFNLYTERWRNDEDMRQLNWDGLYLSNYNAKKLFAEGANPNYNGSTYILENRHSNQLSFAFNSTLNHRLNEYMTLQGGVGFNYTKATYYKTMRDASRRRILDRYRQVYRARLSRRSDDAHQRP